MNQDSDGPMTPKEASRKGLEQLDEHPHHGTTEETHRGATDAPVVDTPPTEQHRGGPLPYQKR